jgi:hypothetical protein
MPNLRGLFANLSTIGTSPKIILLATVGASMAVFYWSLRQWKLKGAAEDTRFNLCFSHLIVTTLLVSYHLYVHDLTLLAIPLSILLNYGTSENRSAPMSRSAVLFLLIVFSQPVVSLLLPLRLMSLTAIGLLFLAVVLSYELRRRRYSNDVQAQHWTRS